MKNKENDVVEVHPCAGCHYWRTCGLDHCCHYILVVGHSRGCPSGEQCTKKIPVSAELLAQEREELYQKMAFGKGSKKTKWR